MQFFKKIAICCCIPLFIVACSSSDDNKPSNSPNTSVTPIIEDPISLFPIDDKSVRVLRTKNLNIIPGSSEGALSTDVTKDFYGYEATLDQTSALQTTHWIHRAYLKKHEEPSEIIYEEPSDIIYEEFTKIDKIMSKTAVDHDNGKGQGDYLYKYTRVIASVDESTLGHKEKDDGEWIFNPIFSIAADAEILATAYPTKDTMAQLTKENATYKYQGSVFGMVPNPEKIGHEGDLTLTAEFGKREIIGEVKFNGLADHKPADFKFKGEIDKVNTGKFRGATNKDGTIWGAFTGSGAEEMGGSYKNEDSQGVFIGHKEKEDR